MPKQTFLRVVNHKIPEVGDSFFWANEHAQLGALRFAHYRVNLKKTLIIL